MATKISKDDSYEVCDSTDWLETPLSSLTPVDSALRCQVCKDFYTTPMITSCSHTFCSICIRRCLSNDGRCPACRTQDQELKLRYNALVEDMVEAFKKARPQLIEMAKRQVDSASSRSPKRKYGEADFEEDGSPVRKTRRSGRRTQQSSQQVMIRDSDGDDEDYSPEGDKKGLVLCPICHDSFPTAQAVDSHIDHCDRAPRSKERTIKSNQASVQPASSFKPTKSLERLPTINFSMVKDNALRKKLSDLGVSAVGSRQLMERRYTEYLTLWNANCDSKNPKAKGELRKELEVWERTQGGRAPISSSSNSGANLKDKDFDGAAWSSKHDDSFRQLIENARRKRAAKIYPPENTPSSDAVGGSADVTPALRQSIAEVEMTEDDAPTTYPPDEAYNEVTPTLFTEPTGSLRILFEKRDQMMSGETNNPSSSQYQTSQGLNKDVEIDSDMATLRTLQP